MYIAPICTRKSGQASSVAQINHASRLPMLSETKRWSTANVHAPAQKWSMCNTANACGPLPTAINTAAVNHVTSESA